HELQNPTSAEKIRLLGERLGLGGESRVLDLASGRGGPALILAREVGCHGAGIEVRPPFVEGAPAPGPEAGLAPLPALRLGRPAEIRQGEFHVVMRLGATSVWGGLEATLAALSPVAPTLAIGEPYWRVWPLPEDYPERDEPFAILEETLGR